MYIATGTTGTTINPGDVLNGGAGTDTLTLTVSGTNGGAGQSITAAVQTDSIENVLLSNFNTGAAVTTVDGTSFTGAASVGLSSSGAAGDTTFSGLGNIVGAQMKNGSGDLTVNYQSTVVTGAADTQTLDVSNVSAGTFAADAGIETVSVTVASAGVASTLTALTAAGAATLNIDADKALTITNALGTNLTTINAAASSAAVTLALGTAALTVTGGTGNDVIRIDGSTVNTSDSINAGTGTDTLVLTAATNVATAANGAKLVGFEKVYGLKNAADASLVVAQNLTVLGSTISEVGTSSWTSSTAVGGNNDHTATDGVNFTNAAAGTNLAISGVTVTGLDDDDGEIVNFTATVDLLNDTSADSITVTLGTATAVQATVTTGTNSSFNETLALADYETINLVSQGSAAGVNAVASLTSADLTTLNITATSALTVVANTAASLATVNASASTAAVVFTAAFGNGDGVSVTGGSGNDSFIGAGGNDTLAGGAGVDTLTGGAGNDIITGAAGNDTINGGAGIDNISGGDDDDTILVTTTTDFIGLSAVETVAGGAGNDTLSFSQAATAITIGAADLAGISGIETISINGTSGAGSITLTNAVYTANGVADLAIVDGDLTDGGLTVAASALTGTNTVTVTANTTTAKNDNLVGGAGNDTFIFATTAGLEAADIVSGGTSTVAGGTGIDTISLTATAAVTADLTGVTAVDRIVTTGTGGDVIITVGAATVVAAGATLTVDASSVTNNNFDLAYNGSAATQATGVQNVTGTAGDDTIAGGSGNDIIVGADGADSITGGAGIDNLSGGAGADRFIVGTAAHFTGLDAAETVSGGTGNDTLAFAAGLTPVVTANDLMQLRSVEIIESLNVADNFTVTLTDAVYTADGVTALTIDATTMTTGDLTLTASTLSAANSVTVEYENAGDSATSNIALGAGNDTVKLAVARLDDVATIAGGTGTDTLTLSTGATATMGANITGFEVINFATNLNTAALITTVDANVASGATLTVNGATPTTARAITFNGSAELDGKFSITGGAEADTFTGGAKIDTISGGAGADTITGGLLADSLTGGIGADTFVYASVAQSSGANVDSITDFVSATDKLNVTLNYSTISSGAVVNAVVQTAAAGLAAAQDALSGARGEAIYDTTGSALYINFNADNLLTSSDYKIAINAASTAADTIAEGDINFVITGGSGTDSITAGGGADTIDGGASADTISGGAGADSITAGTGADNITGGAGADTIVLGGAGDVDTIVFGASAALNGVDTITGFTTTADKINLDALTAEAASTSAAVGDNATATVAAGKVYVLSGQAAGTADTAAAVATVLSGAAGSAWTNAANGIVAYFVVSDNNSGSIWSYTEAGGTEIAEAELTLMGTVDAVIVAGDLLFA